MVPPKRLRRPSPRIIRIAAGKNSQGVRELVVTAVETKIVLGTGASASFFLTIPKHARGRRSIDVTLGKGTTLFLLLLQERSDGLQISQHVAVGERASAHFFNVTLGGRVSHALRSEISGQSGRSTVDWIFHASGKDDVYINAANIFSARDGSGDIVIRGAAQDRAYVRVEGEIRIGKKGGGTQTHLSEHILLLDATAKADAVPTLKIETNDVQAGHAASVTKVSPEDLFYLGTRGIKKVEARHMLIRGFLGSLLAHITNPALRHRVRAALAVGA